MTALVLADEGCLFFSLYGALPTAYNGSSADQRGPALLLAQWPFASRRLFLHITPLCGTI